MNRKLARIGALGASAAVATGGLVLCAGAASAATVLGTISVSPATGTTSTNFTVNTSAGCPANDTRIAAIIFPKSSPSSTMQLIGRTGNGVSTSPMSVGISDNLFNLAQANGVTLNAGEYDMTLYCLAGSTTQIANADGEFDGKIFVTGTPSQGTQQPFQSTDTAAATSTTTLAASPSGSATTGQQVTLTATVSSPSPGTNTGTVQFKDGGTNLGSPATVTAGQATFSSTTLAAGAHSFTAVYSGDTETLGSNSNTVTYSVTVPQTPTTTSLSAPASIGQFSPATFNVTTSPNTTSGPVTLTENGATIGNGTVTNGVGTVTATFSTQGSHTVVANFTPSDTTFGASSSQPVTVTVGASTGVSTSETIETTVAAGSLTISVANNPTVVLPTPTLDANAGLLTTTGPINPVTVTDTRAGAPGFTVSGIVTDFADGAATPDIINGYNLGWSPFIVDNPAGMHITAGPTVNPAPGVAPGATPTDTTLGLKSLRTLATDPAGGLGTTHLGATLTLDAPTSTVAGTYDATLTLTAI